MENGYCRKVTRSPVWPETEAVIRYSDPFKKNSKNHLTAKGRIGDLGSSGMFFLTDEHIPLDAEVDVTINFDPESSRPDLLLTAVGRTVRATRDGVGIKFSAIDLKQLQKCIVSKINR